jgi:uncharacterized protein (TIGR02145 family)
MKKLLIFAVLAATSLISYAQVSIGTVTPEASAALDVTSTTGGLLPPRMTQTERHDITTTPAAAGLIVYCTDCGANGELQLFNGASWVNMAGDAAAVPVPVSVSIPSVTSLTTGKVWMDRNLGATQVAESSTDEASYGDLYQWGRKKDGHQIRTSRAYPGPVKSGAEDDWFIKGSYDWLDRKDDTRWAAPRTANDNDPCPPGFKVPSQAELEAERNNGFWENDSPQNNASGALNSVLRLPMAGYRTPTGVLPPAGSNGNYWSSTVGNTSAVYLRFDGDNAVTGGQFRANGCSVRCIKIEE